jgi:hypothetical protein
MSMRTSGAGVILKHDCSATFLRGLAEALAKIAA